MISKRIPDYRYLTHNVKINGIERYHINKCDLSNTNIQPRRNFSIRLHLLNIITLLY